MEDKMKKLLSKGALMLLYTTGVIAVDPAVQVGNEIFTQEKLLPAGVDSTIATNPYTGESGPARKGIIAATLNNIVLLNKYLSENMSATDVEKVQEISQVIESLVPSLRVVGIFDLFNPEEWFSSRTQPGRLFATVLYLQKYPQEMTPNIRKQLENIQKQTKIKVLSELIEKVLKGSY